MGAGAWSYSTQWNAKQRLEVCLDTSLHSCNFAWACGIMGAVTVGRDFEEPEALIWCPSIPLRLQACINSEASSIQPNNAVNSIGAVHMHHSVQPAGWSLHTLWLHHGH